MKVILQEIGLFYGVAIGLVFAITMVAGMFTSNFGYVMMWSILAWPISGLVILVRYYKRLK